MASATDSSKRRRLLGDAASLDAIISCLLSDLPSGILTNVANYLDAPSRLFFAAALTTHQITAASDERNSAIVDSERTTLDFGDIEKDLAAKLSDGDICAVLICIDAVNRLKTLKLTNCINISGAGLEPLRGSTIIEQIDLSLVGKHQSPRLSSRPPISCEFVLPILDSIIEREGCSLRHLQFPSVWSEGGERVQFEQFIGRYNEMINRGGIIINCAKCSAHLPPQNESLIDDYGTDRSQNYTCYECLKYYCEVCKDDDDEYMLSYCSLCEKRLWISQTVLVLIVAKTYAKIALHRTLSASNAADVRVIFAKSIVCFCNECNEKNGQKAIQFCEDCHTYYCGDCRVSSMCQVDGSTQDCTGCMQLTGPLLLEEVKKVRKENKEVKAENGYKQDHINYLKEQLQYQKEQVKELEKKMKQLESGEDG
eukprot:scaffold2901_cov91-Skeletonema_dohrnii-CCMP3373.AAC.19